MMTMMSNNRIVQDGSTLEEKILFRNEDSFISQIYEIERRLAREGRAHQVPPSSSQPHLIHIRLTLLETQRLVKRVGLDARGGRGEMKVDGREFGAGEVDDALQQSAVDPLAPVGRRDHDILDSRLPARRGLIDTQGGASDNVLLVVLSAEDSRSRRRHRPPLHLVGHRQPGIQLLHKSQQISDLRVGQGTKFNVSHSIWEMVLVRYLNRVASCPT